MLNKNKVVRIIILFLCFFFCLINLSGQENIETYWAIGFFNALNEDGTVEILASYQKFVFILQSDIKIEELDLMPGHLVEFEYYEDEVGFVIVQMINHKIPTKSELGEIFKRYE